MKVASLISRTIKTLPFPEANVRELRALFVAQVVAYKIPLEGESVDAVIESTEEYMKTILNDVNEFTAVDVRLCMDLWKRLVKARWELLYGCSDVSLILYGLTSDTTKDNLNSDYRGLTNTLTSIPQFSQATQAVLGALSESQ